MPLSSTDKDGGSRYSIERGLRRLSLVIVLSGLLAGTAVAEEIRFRVDLLPEGPGTESRGNVVEEWFSGGDPMVAVGGEVMIGPTHVPSLWLNRSGTWEPPILLPDLGFGGHVKDLAGTTFPGGSYVATGLVLDAGGLTHPAYWESTDPQGPYTRIELPYPVGGGGEVLSVGDLVYLIRFAGGWTADSSGIPVAAVWTRAVAGTWSRTDLPPFAVGEESVVTDITVVSPGDFRAAGYSQGEQGPRTGIEWTFNKGGWSAPLPFPALMVGAESQVNRFEYDALDRLVAGGWSETIGGAIHGALWIEENGMWSIRELFPPDGHQNAMVNHLNAMIDVLFLAGSADNGPGTEMAAAWRSDDGGMTFDAFLLEDRVQGPNPLDLREALGIVAAGIDVGQPMLQITGWGTIGGPTGGSAAHAFVLTQQRAVIGGRKNPDHRIVP